MNDDQRVILDGPAIAAELGLNPGTLNNWASAGKLQRRGRDRRGRTLFDLDEAIAVLRGDTPSVDPGDRSGEDVPG